MKVFISHSWKNKTPAQLIADALADSAEVWLDVQQLKAGDRIQAAIDEALAEMDAVVVLWSRDAAESDGVDAELRSTVRLEKKLLPVLLDDTPVERHPALAGLYGINLDAADPKGGIFRVQAALVRIMAGELDLDATDALNALTSFEGFYQYVQEYRNRKDIGDPSGTGEDAAQWALRSMEQTNKAYQSLSDLRDQVGITLQFMRDTLARVEAAGDDRAAIQSILDEVIRHPKSQTKDFQVLVTFVQGKLAGLAPAMAPAARPRNPGATADALSERMERAAPPVPQGPPAQPAATAPADAEDASPGLALVEAYIRSAPGGLRAFAALAAASQSAALQWVASELDAYLTHPDDLVPDDQNGLLGFIDDAWLIHNTIYRCVEAGFFAPEAIGADWNAIVQADALIVSVLAAPIRGALEQLLMQYMQVIANELAGYAPQFAAQTGTNSYAAFMGEGAAVGAAPSGGDTGTIDDVVFSIGGKMVYYGGS